MKYPPPEITIPSSSLDYLDPDANQSVAEINLELGVAHVIDFDDVDDPRLLIAFIERKGTPPIIEDRIRTIDELIEANNRLTALNPREIEEGQRLRELRTYQQRMLDRSELAIEQLASQNYGCNQYTGKVNKTTGRAGRPEGLLTYPINRSYLENEAKYIEDDGKPLHENDGSIRKLVSQELSALYPGESLGWQKGSKIEKARGNYIRRRDEWLGEIRAHLRMIFPGSVFEGAIDRLYCSGGANLVDNVIADIVARPDQFNAPGAVIDRILRDAKQLE